MNDRENIREYIVSISEIIPEDFRGRTILHTTPPFRAGFFIVNIF